MKITTPQKYRNFDPDKVSEVFGKLLEVFGEGNLTIGEIIVAYGNLGYSLGASIEGYDKGPSVDDLKQSYYQNPTPGVAMMLQGLEVTSWYEDWIKAAQETRGKMEENSNE